MCPNHQSGDHIGDIGALRVSVLAPLKALRVCGVVGVVGDRKTGQGREAELCERVRVKPVIRGERIVDLDTRSVMRL